MEGNCLIDGYVSSLSEEVHVDLSKKQIDRVGRPLGDSQWTQQEKVLRPIWIDSIVDKRKDR